MTAAWTRALLPLAVIVAIAAVFITTRPLDFLSAGVPPAEELTVERATLDGQGLHLTVRSGAWEPLTVAQVQVDGAYWEFTLTPDAPLGRLAAARLDIPYPWTAGEPHIVKVVTSTGATFEHTIAVAATTPRQGAADFAVFAVVGLMVGVVPVATGMLFFPLLRRISRRGLDFVLALTIGLLAFLLIDTLEEGLEAAAKAATGLQAGLAVWLAAGATFLTLMWIGRRGGRRPEGRALAFYIALGIGLHNLGEGLAIGASFAIGETALASFLIVGFMLHNVTEGVGISAPLVGERPGWPLFAGLAAVAGLPAVVGTWAGAFAFAPHWAVLCFGIGAGAILQVIVEVGAFIGRRASAAGDGWLTGSGLAGFAAGLAVMYGTALLI